MKNRKMFLRTIWWVYILLLFVVVVIKFRGSVSALADKICSTEFGTNYNLVPFKTIDTQLEHISEGWAVINVLGNIIPFVPFGFLLPTYFKKAKTFKKVFAVGFLFIVFAEAFQFITRLGSFDVDDIILNMVGIIFGYILLRVLQLVLRKN